MHNVLTINQALLTLDGVEYGDAVSSATAVPTASSTTWTPISGNSQQKQGRASWAFNVTLGQDFDPAALHRYLFENEGKENVPVSFKPAGATGPSFDAVVASIPAPQIGGAADAVATADVVLGLTGKPAVDWPI